MDLSKRDRDPEQNRQELRVDGMDTQCQLFPRENPSPVNAQIAPYALRAHSAPDIRAETNAQENACKKDEITKSIEQGR